MIPHRLFPNTDHKALYLWFYGKKPWHLVRYWNSPKLCHIHHTSIMGWGLCLSNHQAFIKSGSICDKRSHWLNAGKLQQNWKLFRQSPHSNMIVGISVNSSPPGQNGCHFTDDIFRCIFMNDKFCILIKISLKLVRKGPIGNNPALV